AHNWPGNIRQLEHTVEKALILSDSSILQYKDFDIPDPQPVARTENITLEDMERNAISAAIKQNRGNMSEVARQLGITRQTLYNKLRKYGL
ncbi:MAG: sigma-54-dependent Fis family transcriptional regulator, partial [Muribaculaceae bacterium]|nr:sigma-54-dependent Fis family transcriptional regulator [Muribaculaceae bacterium]